MCARTCYRSSNYRNWLVVSVGTIHPAFRYRLSFQPAEGIVIAVRWRRLEYSVRAPVGLVAGGGHGGHTSSLVLDIASPGQKLMTGTGWDRPEIGPSQAPTALITGLFKVYESLSLLSQRAIPASSAVFVVNMTFSECVLKGHRKPSEGFINVIPSSVLLEWNEKSPVERDVGPMTTLSARGLFFSARYGSIPLTFSSVIPPKSHRRGLHTVLITMCVAEKVSKLRWPVFPCPPPSERILVHIYIRKSRPRIQARASRPNAACPPPPPISTHEVSCICNPLYNPLYL